jgi:hypothetical protein
MTHVDGSGTAPTTEPLVGVSRKMASVCVIKTELFGSIVTKSPREPPEAMMVWGVVGLDISLTRRQSHIAFLFRILGQQNSLGSCHLVPSSDLGQLRRSPQAYCQRGMQLEARFTRRHAFERWRDVLDHV